MSWDEKAIFQGSLK